MADSKNDALLLLRNSIKSNSQITYENDDGSCDTLSAATTLVLSDGFKIAKTTPTRFRKPTSQSTDPNANPEGFYTAEAILLTWLLRDAAAGDYMRQAREAGLAVGFVSVTDRKAVVDWLEEKTQTHERIITLESKCSTPPSTPPLASRSLPQSGSHPQGDSTPQSSPEKRAYVPDPKDATIVKKIRLSEVELRDRTTVLRGIKSNNFSSLRSTMVDKIKHLKEAPKQPNPKLVAKKPRNQHPIIIIPSSPTSLITMLNVRKFLEDSQFEASEEARARMASEGIQKLEDMIPVYRKRSYFGPNGQETAVSGQEKSMRYFVVDGIEALGKFGPDAWDRVVCVMTTGQAWQFKPYKWSDPRQLFHHVKGVYVTWTNSPANPNIRDWNVTELKIDPNRRHVDKSVVASFWRELDGWMQMNKPWLVT
ncbi:hypothetical protein BOTBODRAFT_104124 [Botryobasidium botryosum FD-172 SS1]|uniref:Cell division control protein 73 C-terminal domain-containing protein n=1 Tax=Botryobasidium botryosum (strain FD-172 SS1) TaxID=930990 RepID=A0A067MVB8_BOTB1|nr:hypothetical protein BOTBODRAFT_104124 [Botryobasidium botryosum FD-172 SS1]